jgi:cell division protein FtsI (penicillin-binding protein 3)
MLFLLAGIVVLLGRAAWLEVYQQEWLQKQADKRHSRNVTVTAHRGLVLDRNGEALAISAPVKTLICNPRTLIHEREELKQAFEKARREWEAQGRSASQAVEDAYELARINFHKFDKRLQEAEKILELEKGAFLKNLEKNRSKQFMYVAQRVDPDRADKVLAMELSEVIGTVEYKRFYPMGEAAGHVIGFTDHENKGAEGIERSMESTLAGQEGKVRVIKDRKHNIVEEIERMDEMKPGRDIKLSIDRRLQYLAYKALKGRVYELKAQTGSVVVMKPQTGEILAMASMPYFNPNDRNTFEAYKYRNRAVVDMFEPGSTIKPLTIAAALEARVIDKHVNIQTSPGLLKLSNKNVVRDIADYGSMSLPYMLAKSSNVGASKVALLTPKRDHWMFLKRLGLGNVPGAGFSVEAEGRLTNYEKWGKVDHASLGYGYGLSTSLLQMVRAYTPFATGGKLYPVTITKLDKPVVGQQVMSPQTAYAVLDMMEAVVKPKATGKQAAINGYRVAGKTGTARKVINRKYRTDKFITSFIGVAPVSRPELVVGVMIDDPEFNKSGGKAAAPVFQKVMSGALRILDVPPDKLMGQQDAPDKVGVIEQPVPQVTSRNDIKEAA